MVMLLLYTATLDFKQSICDETAVFGTSTTFKSHCGGVQSVDVQILMDLIILFH